ncbi:MAG: hypothetical protein QOI80_3181, partial [Solirubrobacteraceae bacterium]|nr:hypothetical protein [Solirubrobacteraceae bacterium]
AARSSLRVTSPPCGRRCAPGLRARVEDARARGAGAFSRLQMGQLASKRL